MAAFEEGKSMGADILCIQELYIGEGILSNLAFDIGWVTVRKRKEQRVGVGIVVSTRGRLVVEA